MIVHKVDLRKFKDQATSCSKQLQLLETTTAKLKLDKIKRSKKKVSGKRSKKKVSGKKKAKPRSGERKKKKNNVKRACGRGTKEAFRCALPPFK